MKQKEKAIFFFFLIDALGWEYIRNRGFLKDILPYQNSLKTILGFSSAAIPSILTGKYPSEHGQWNLFYYSPETSPFKWTKILHLFPESILNSRYVRKGINVISKRLGGYKGYFSSYGVPAKILPYFDVCEKHNIYEPGSFSDVENIFDYFMNHGISVKTYTYHSYRDDQALNEVLKEVGNNQESAYFVYLSELDAFLHSHCKDSKMVEEMLGWYEEKLKEIFLVAKNSGRPVRSFVFSDHGMTPIKSTHDLLGLLQQSRSKVPTNFIYTLDSTMARFWFFNEKGKEEVTNILSAQTFGHILKNEDLTTHGIKFPDNRYGELIFLMNPGELIFPGFMGKIPFEGMHGFHPDDKYSYGSFMTNCKDISIPTKITDLFQLFAHEIGKVEISEKN